MAISEYESLPESGFEVARGVCYVTGPKVMKAATLRISPLDLCREVRQSVTRRENFH